MQKIDFLKFYVINTSDNLPFQPYYSNPNGISFQKIHVLSVVQFIPKKMCPFADNFVFNMEPPSPFHVHIVYG